MYIADDLAAIASNNGLTNVAAVNVAVGASTDTSQLRSFTTLTAADGIYYNKGLNTLVITKAGATFDGIDFRGVSINVQVDNVTITNSYFDASTGIYAINALPGTKNLTVDHSTFDGLKLDNINYVDFVTSRGENTVLTNNAFLDAPADAVSIQSGTIAGNYFAGSGYATGAHADAIWIGKTIGPVVITDNVIDWRSRADAPTETNEAIRITGENGNVSDVTVTKNILLGGSMTVLVSDGATQTHSASQVGSVTDVTIKDNVVDYGKYGSLEQTSRPADLVYADNNHASGMPVTPGAEAAGVLPDLSTLNRIDGSTTTAVLKGTEGADYILGGSGSNNIYGGAGNDIIEGGDGRDYLYGGDGADTFVFRSLTASGKDWIADFETGKDKIDLATLLGAPEHVNDWQWLGTESFTGHDWQLRYEVVGTTTTIQIDADGDLKADLEIQLNGSQTLSTSDFILGLTAPVSTPGTPAAPPTVATSLDFLGGRIETGDVTSVQTKYSAAGKLVSTEFDNGVYNRIEYDANGRPKQLITQHDDGSRTLDQYNYDGTAAAHRHLEYGADGKQVVEQRFDANGSMTYETVVSESGGKTSMIVLADGTHTAAYGADGSMLINDHVKLDGSHVTVVKAEGQRVEGSTHDDQFTSFSNDTFVFADNFGNDTIRGFKAGTSAGHDTLELSSSVHLSDITLSYTSYDHNTVVHVGDHGTITLANVHVNNVSDLGILFV